MILPCPGSDTNTTASPANKAAETPSNSISAAPTYCSACFVQLLPSSSSASVIHNPEQDLYITGRPPKTPPGIAEMKGSASNPRPQDTRRAPDVYVMTTDDDCDFAKQASPNNTPLIGLSMDSFGSMNKPSPNNTPMCDRYVQDRGAKYPDNVPQISASPNRMKDGCEVKYGGANPCLNRDNGSSWSVLNHIKFGKD